MKWMTEIELPAYTNKLSYRKPAVWIGSCFAENIGNWLKEYCFPLSINPFGIVYNPVSAAKVLDHLVENKPFLKENLFFDQGQYHSFFHHSRFSDKDENRVLALINKEISNGHQTLRDASHVLITFGTAWVFEHVDTGIIVSNCHKIHPQQFRRFRLRIEDILSVWNPLIERMIQFNPSLTVTFTVSPIRHLKDGAHENQLSKATLLLAIDQLTSEHCCCNYFPSYELMLDELRDYRFYDADLSHPNSLAVGHIREKFTSALIDPESRKILTEIERIVLAIEHRPFDSFSERYQNFLQTQIEKAQKLEKDYPIVKLNGLIEKLKQKIVV